MCLLQPIARSWGRLRHRERARRGLPRAAAIPGPATPMAGGVLLLPDTGDRVGVTSEIVAELRRVGLRVLPATGWEDFDARIVGSLVVFGELVTSAHPIGSVQMKIRRRLRRRTTFAVLAAALLLFFANPWLGVVALVGLIAAFVLGFYRTGASVRRIIIAAASP
jgi:hypothetical protein